MKNKWLKFELVENKQKTSVWNVVNKNDEVLGIVKWYPQWRQYCFKSFWDYDRETIYSQSCLRDIANFIKEQMDKRKK